MYVGFLRNSHSSNIDNNIVKNEIFNLIIHATQKYYKEDKKFWNYLKKFANAKIAVIFNNTSWNENLMLQINNTSWN